MTEIFAQPDDFGEVRASELHSSLGERIGAQAGEAFMGGVRTAARLGEYQRAEQGDFSLAAQAGRIRDRIAAGEDASVVAREEAQRSRERTYTPAEVSLGDAKAQVKQQGLEGHLTLPDQPTIKQPVLDLMLQHADERRQYDAAVSRGPQGFLSGALGFVTELGAGIIDPLNAAAFAVPVIGEARYGMMLRGAGDSIAARAGINLGVGAATGAVGSAALTPADWWLHTKDGQDYTMADALRSVALGAGMGGAFHAGGGVFGDLRSRSRGEALPGSVEDLQHRALAGDVQAAEQLSRTPRRDEPGVSGAPAVHVSPEDIPGISSEPELSPIERVLRAPNEVPPAHPAEVLADLPPRVREDVMRAATADVINGNAVRAGELLNEAAKESPRIAQSLSAARADVPPLPEGATFAGHGEHGPIAEGLEGRWTEAVDWLQRTHDGDARGVLEHPGVPGGKIDVIWGEGGVRGYGLAHIADLHPEVLPDLPERLARMKVDHVVLPGKAGERIILRSADGASAVVRTRWDNDKKVWLLTAYTPESDRRGGGTTGSPSGSRGPAQSPDPSAKANIRDGGADWKALDDAKQPADADLVENSRVADHEPAPASIDPDKAPSAAEKAAHEANELLAELRPKLTEEERQVFDDALAKLDQDKAVQEQMVRDGAACLAEAAA